jgi:hypothetical protein
MLLSFLENRLDSRSRVYACHPSPFNLIKEVLLLYLLISFFFSIFRNKAGSAVLLVPPVVDLMPVEGLTLIRGPLILLL